MEISKGECRACRCQETRSRRHQFLTENGLDKVYSELTQIQLQRGTKFNLICQKCCRMLQNYSEFRMQCLVSNSYFEGLESEIYESDDKEDIEVNADGVEIKVEPDAEFEALVKLEEEQTEVEQKIKVKRERKTEKKQGKSAKSSTLRRAKSVSKRTRAATPECSESELTDPVPEEESQEYKKTKKEVQVDEGIQGVQPIEPASQIFLCPNCPDKVFTKKGYYKEHLKTHKEGKYICHFCDRKFTKKYFVLGHIDRNHLEKDYGKKGEFPCNQCEKRYLTPFRLKKHLGIHKLKMRPCPHCGKMVKNLTSHLLHHDDPPERYQCDQCPKNYKSKQHLFIHAKVHENKYYPCHLCGRPFNRPDKLQVHMKIHDPNRKTFECTECHKNFTFKTALTTHMRTHTGERPYQCLVCGMAFAMSGNLQKHMHTHTGTKPYMCGICNYGTKKKTDYHAHVRQLHPEAAYTLGPMYAAVETNLTPT